MRGTRTLENIVTMKKAPGKRAKVSGQRVSAPKKASRTASVDDEMRPHYDFDYSKSRPNRFASRLSADTVAVVLDPDVATVFRSAEAVNTFLRSAITAMPAVDRPKKKRAS